MTTKRRKQTEHSPLKRRLVLFWLPVIVIAGGMAYLSQTRYNPTNEAKYGLQRLNQWRKQAGVPTLAHSPTLQKAAQNHAQYLTQDAHGHDELNRNNPHFTGMTPQERANVAGYPASISENLTLGNFARSARKSVDGLMTALYHRLSMLNPEHDEAGTAWARGKNSTFVIKQGSSYDRKLCENAHNSTAQKRYVLTLPCNNVKTEIPIDSPPPRHTMAVKYPIGNNIDPSYDGKEQPNPMPNYKQTGNPISIAFFGEQGEIRMSAFKLFDEQKREITHVHIMTASNDPNHLLDKTEFALFPLKPMEFNQNYYVEFHYQQDGKDKVEKWSFKTRKKRHFLENIF